MKEFFLLMVFLGVQQRSLCLHLLRQSQISAADLFPEEACTYVGCMSAYVCTLILRGAFKVSCQQRSPTRVPCQSFVLKPRVCAGRIVITLCLCQTPDSSRVPRGDVTGYRRCSCSDMAHDMFSGRGHAFLYDYSVHVCLRPTLEDLDVPAGDVDRAQELVFNSKGIQRARDLAAQHAELAVQAVRSLSYPL